MDILQNIMNTDHPAEALKQAATFSAATGLGADQGTDSGLKGLDLSINSLLYCRDSRVPILGAKVFVWAAPLTLGVP